MSASSIPVPPEEIKELIEFCVLEQENRQSVGAGAYREEADRAVAISIAMAARIKALEAQVKISNELIEKGVDAVQAGADRIKELETDIEKLKDPIAVFYSMMAGTIAIPSWTHCEHLHQGMSQAIERRLLRLEVALEPFARAADKISHWQDHESHWTGAYAGLTVGDLRRARAAKDGSAK
jgi:hypothetical protein